MKILSNALIDVGYDPTGADGRADIECDAEYVELRKTIAAFLASYQKVILLRYVKRALTEGDRGVAQGHTDTRIGPDLSWISITEKTYTHMNNELQQKLSSLKNECLLPKERELLRKHITTFMDARYLSAPSPYSGKALFNIARSIVISMTFVLFLFSGGGVICH